MRNYLFRGKTENGVWVYGSLIKKGKFCCILDNDDSSYDYPYLDAELGIIDGTVTPVIPETVGQFTGLFIMEDTSDGDSEVTFIFEGDIVESHLGYRYIVQWDDRRGCYDFYNPQTSFNPTETFKIIGNIHDNPELLKED